jgi:mannosyltransferase
MLARISSRLAEWEHNPRYQYVALGLITLLAALLRFYKLGEWSFWIDELFTIGHAQAHYSSLELIARHIPPNRNWIPLSVMLTAGTLNVLGTSEWSARLVSAVIGVISVPVLYVPVKRLFNPGVGLIAVLLLAVSPWHLYWSQNARFLTSLMLLYSLALFAFYFGLEQDRPGYLLLSMALLYLAASERLYGAFLVPVVVSYLLLLKIAPFEKAPGLRVRNLVLLALPAIAFGIFEIYSYVTTGSSITVYTLDGFAGQVNHSPFRLLASLTYRIGIPLICLGTLGGVVLLVQRRRAGILLCSAAWVPPLILLLMTPFAFTVDRYVFVSLPFWIILGAVAVHELVMHADKVGKILSFGVLLLLVAEPLSEDALYYQYQNGNRPDWRGAFALVRREKEEGDLVAATRPELGEYYLGEEVIPINGIDPGTIAQGGRRVWFVIDEATSWVDPDLREWIGKNSELINVLAVSMPGKSLNITVYLYDPPRASPFAVPSGDLHRCDDDAGATASARSGVMAVHGRSELPEREP